MNSLKVAAEDADKRILELHRGRSVVVKTFIVNTMPRRSAEDIVTQSGGVLRARSTPPPEPPPSTWNPFQELEIETEERVHVRVRAEFHEPLDSEGVPDGMEGSYYL